MRVRITFSKGGPLIYTGNLDLLTIWERAARRADLPLAYTHGFHPQPKIQLAAPLPLGFSSRREVMDMYLDEDVDCTRLPARLQVMMPEGIHILGLEVVEAGASALQSQLEAAEYEVQLAERVKLSDLVERTEALLAAPSLPRERRRKPYDLRPLIAELHAEVPPDQTPPRIRMRLTAREGATGRPDEVLDALGIPREDCRIERVALIFRSGA